MKKIALCSVIACLGIIDAGFAADKGTYNCNVQSMSAFSWKLSNEFLFPTTADYKDSNGRALVCGHRGTNGCNNGTTVVVAGNHYFGEVPTDYMKVYRCSTGGPNAWADVGYSALPECNSSQKTNWNKIGEIQGQKILCKDKIDTFYRGGYCKNACFTSDCPDCDAVQQPKQQQQTQCKATADTCCDLDGTVVKKDGLSASPVCPSALQDAGAAVCSCRCDGNDMWTCDINQCKGVNGSYKYDAKGTNSSGGKGVCKDTTGGNGGGCSKYKGYAERYACCLAGNATKWEGDTKAPYKGTCVCVDSAKQWNGNTCVAKNGGDGNNGGDGDNGGGSGLSDCTYNYSVNITCNDGTTFFRGKQVQLTKEQAERIGCNTASAMTNQFSGIQSLTDIVKATKTEIESVNELMALLCSNHGGYIPVKPNGPDSVQISNAKSAIDSFFTTAQNEKSVWKDAEGKFNTARLASDLTAGVVLGTVGGVVSGVVIKKKQVEKGFEALHCTVGGQPVADWGDEFSVGLQR